MVAIWTIWNEIRRRMGRYARSVMQPGRMSGERIGFGNRR
jgi:hypothetical protein